MQNYLKERKQIKREHKIEFYSALVLVVTLFSITIGLEILWITKI